MAKRTKQQTGAELLEDAIYSISSMNANLGIQHTRYRIKDDGQLKLGRHLQDLFACQSEPYAIYSRRFLFNSNSGGCEVYTITAIERIDHYNFSGAAYDLIMDGLGRIKRIRISAAGSETVIQIMEGQVIG